jgi:hypothetical protein
MMKCLLVIVALVCVVSETRAQLPPVGGTFRNYLSALKRLDRDHSLQLDSLRDPSPAARRYYGHHPSIDSICLKGLGCGELQFKIFGDSIQKVDQVTWLPRITRDLGTAYRELARKLRKQFGKETLTSIWPDPSLTFASRWQTAILERRDERYGNGYILLTLTNSDNEPVPEHVPMHRFTDSCSGILSASLPRLWVQESGVCDTLPFQAVLVVASAGSVDSTYSGLFWGCDISDVRPELVALSLDSVAI